MSKWDKIMFYIMLTIFPLSGLNSCGQDFRIDNLQKEVKEINQHNSLLDRVERLEKIIGGKNGTR